MNVAENLYDYLKHNDRAELIGFGTFYVKNSSAKINDLTGTIEPPKRELLFTRQQTGDRSFVSFMAQNEFISEQTAYTWIKQYSDSLNEKIQSGRSFVLGKLGKLEKGLLEEYAFTPADNLNLLDNAFALGTLKNVQTFDQERKDIDLICTKSSALTPQEQKTMPEEFEEKKNDIEQQIEKARQIKEEIKIQETVSQTEQRIIQHTEAVIETEVTTPESVRTTEEKLDVDSVTTQDKTQQTIDRAAEFKENVVVEDIKPAEPQEKKSKKEETAAIAQEDVLKKQAEDIVNKHNKSKKETKKIKRKNTRKRKWLIVLWTVIVLLLLCIAFVFAHWMGWLKDIDFVKPVTDKLSYYIPVRETPSVEAEQPLNATTDSVTEETWQEETQEEPTDMSEADNNPSVTPAAVASTQKTKPQTKKNAANKVEKEDDSQNNATTVQEEPVKEDNSPIVTQNYSKLGFDVIGGSYSDKSKAEAQARKARRLGYDGYVISKIKSGTPVYYVSYGSRRTMTDATELMQNMMNRLGGSYYVMSR